jgi:hypothetical protein
MGMSTTYALPRRAHFRHYSDAVNYAAFMRNQLQARGGFLLPKYKVRLTSSEKPKRLSSGRWTSYHITVSVQLN